MFFVFNRDMASIRLDVVVAPFTEFRYVHEELQPSVLGNMSAADAAEEDRKFRFTCAHQVVLTMLRSWSGLMHLADPSARLGRSPLQSLIDILYLAQTETRV